MNTFRALERKLRGTVAMLYRIARHHDDRRLLDSRGRPSGRVRRVLHDTRNRILLMEVTTRGPFGRRTRLFVPGELVIYVTDHAIHVNLSREQLIGAPTLRSALPGPCLDEVYSYFGCSHPASLRAYPGSSYSR
jgi:hypothetical protein